MNLTPIQISNESVVDEITKLIDLPSILEYNQRDHSASEQFREIRRLHNILYKIEKIISKKVHV